MTPSNEVRWSLKTPQRGWGYQDTLALWRLGEELDFYAVYLNDHLYGDALETWTTLASMFSLTTRIRGGTMVTSNSFRHPTILAKMATTVDIIGNGRLILGLGAGNEAVEYETYGMRFPPPRERVERLEEACHLLKAAWSGEPTTWHGRYYGLTGATFAPRPVQRPHPRLILGVKGDRALAVAVRHADEWNWNRSQSDTPEFLARMDRLDELCEAAGRDPASLPRGFGFRRLRAQLDAGRETLAEVVATTQRCIRRGASQIVLMLGEADQFRDEVDFYRRTFIPAVMDGL
ncbi:MAG TPA: LLM class flavin-dependent oxidoreductase [Micromonosporaceae bacterium]|nr:LLM class flavin-dependent oxidoreductase [Micromonosporaceae bacterium]